MIDPHEQDQETIRAALQYAKQDLMSFPRDPEKIKSKVNQYLRRFDRQDLVEGVSEIAELQRGELNEFDG